MPETAPQAARLPLSPLHRIEVAEGLRPLLEHPQEKDFEILSIARKSGPDGRDLVHSCLVVAGKRTRAQYPQAQQYPIHFVKSYHPGSFHRDPQIEYNNSCIAAELLGSPPPIGCDASSFRSCFLPGKPLSRMSPFTNVEPPERCLAIAHEADDGLLIGLWKLAEEVYGKITRLHQARFFHRDLELHNIIVCTSPLEVFLIDFESAEADFKGDDETLRQRIFADLEELLRLAIYLQGGLGRQDSPLARAALEALPRLFRNPATFEARLDAADRRAVGA